MKNYIKNAGKSSANTSAEKKGVFVFRVVLERIGKKWTLAIFDMDGWTMTHEISTASAQGVIASCTAISESTLKNLSKPMVGTYSWKYTVKPPKSKSGSRKNSKTLSNITKKK